MEESNLRALGRDRAVAPAATIAPLSDLATSDSVALATTKAAAILAGAAAGGDSPVSADSLLEDGAAPSTAPAAPAKPQRKYERKTKRFVWPDELHRLFVAAIFDLGLKNASPKALMPFMGAAAASYGLTTEHLKSHLQKYRLNYDRSRAEFLEFYDETAQRNQKRRRRASSRAAASTPSGGEQQTMFVFPIRSHRASISTEGGGDRGAATQTGTSNADDDDDDDEEMDEEDEADSDDAAISKVSARARARSRAESASSAHRASFSTNSTPSLQAAAPAMYYQHMLQQASLASPHHSQSQHDAGRVTISAPTHHAPTQMQQSVKSPVDLLGLAQQYASAQGLRYPSGNGMYDASAAAAAAAAAVSAAASGAPLTDPQWSILASLLSPHLSGAAMGPPSSSNHGTLHRSRSLGAEDAFSLDGGEASDLQMQMHLAMQAQMNLHRQMLTRKVAVSQNGGDGQVPPGTLGGLHHHQWGLQQQQQPPTASSHMPPAHAMRLQLLQQQQHQHQQQLHSLQHQHQHSPHVPPHRTNAPPTASTVSPLDPPSASSAPPPSASAAAAQTTTAASVATTTAPVSNAGGAATGADSVNPLDIYRWDQTDLQMNLSDDEEGDLFSFLRS